MDDLMFELLLWLRDQIAAKRRLADAASPGPWHANAEHDEVHAVDGVAVCDGFALSGRQLRATVDHIAANDPTEVMAECDAHVAILDAYDTVQRYLAENLTMQRDFDYTSELPRLARERRSLDSREQGLRHAVEHIGTIYQRRPGYREKWRP